MRCIPGIVACLIAVCTAMKPSAEVNERSSAWGFFAHKKINRLAVFSLPLPLYDFYRNHIDYITGHAVDADKRRYAMKGEAECHFIDIDHYTSFPAEVHKIIPVRWEEAKLKFTEDTLRKHGIAPWNTYLVYTRLIKAFTEKDEQKILHLSADLGHYIGDIHVPLHTTKNYNGQYTNQEGIHGFWESRLPELFADEYDLFLPKAVYLEEPAKRIWEVIIESHLALDSVLGMEDSLSNIYAAKFTYEDAAGVATRKYSKDYARQYHTALNGMVERRMKSAIELLAALWYTAWINAGQPNLSTGESEKIKSGSIIERYLTDTLQNIRTHE